MNAGVWKRLLACGMTACMLLTGCSADDGRSTAQGPGEPQSYKDAGMELIALMDEKAESDAYIEAMGSSEEIKAYARQFGEGDYTKARAVYEIKFPVEALIRLAGIDTTGMSEKLQMEMTKRMADSIAMMLNSNGGGILSMASSAILTGETSFYGERPEAPVIYLYQFNEEAYPVVAVFTPAQEDIVTATAIFVDNKELGRIDVEAEIQELLASILESGGAQELSGESFTVEVRKLD